MSELERLEELLRIHREKKRKRLIKISKIAAICLFLIIGIGIGIYNVNGGSLFPKKPPTVTEPTTITQVSESESPAATAPETETEKSVSTQITVSLMGDCTLGMDESFGYGTSLNAYYDINGADYFFKNVRSILEEDDLSIVNLEGPLTTSTDKQQRQFAFKGAPEYVDILTAGSIEAANLANNHSQDYGESGFSETKEVLDKANITHFGYDETAIIEIKGIKIGLVGIYELADHLERTQQLKDTIAQVKADGADLTIVSFHWGNELETIPDYHQMTLGKLAIDEGADLVVGHHAHVLQGIEKYRDKQIVYGLGNFCFGGNSSPRDKDTMIFQQTFTFENGELVLDDQINIIPCSISSDPWVNNYQPTPLEGEEAARVLAKIEELTQQIFSSRL